MEGCKQTKDMLYSPSGSEAAWLLRRSRQELREMIRVLIGHPILDHLTKDTNPNCQNCLAAEQSFIRETGGLRERVSTV